MKILKYFSYFFKDSNRVIALLLALICVYCLFPSSFVLQFYPMRLESHFLKTLDPSWALTLNYASLQQLEWGKEFAFTYGPMAYLGLRIGWGADRLAFLIYDIFFFLNLFLICYISYKKGVNKILAALLIISVALVIPTYVGGATALILFYFLVFWILQKIENSNHLYYIIQTVLITLLFYTKFNTAFISLIFYYTTLLYCIVIKKEKKWTLLYAFAPLLTIIMLGRYYNVDLKGYIISGFEIVSGYNQVMNLSDSSHEYLFYLALLVIFFAAIYFLVRLAVEKQYVYKNLMILFLFSVSIYVLYKQAFVRSDLYHNLDFFTYVILLLLCLGYFTKHKFKSKMSLLVVAIVAISLCINFTSGPFNIQTYRTKLVKAPYLKEYRSFEVNEGIRITPPAAPLPERITNKIGNATIDIFPTNTYLLYENSLNYLPRPVMQSYAAYTKHLENLNFNHYNSEKAPQYVLYDYEGIDYRYPLFDEPKVNLVLLKNYATVDTLTFNGHRLLLLEKKKDAKPVQLNFIREYAMCRSSPILPKENIYYEVTFYNTLGGKIQSLLTHAPEISLAIQTMDGVVSEYKTAPSLLESGLFSTISITKTEDFYRLLNNSSFDKDRQIEQYIFRPKSNTTFKEKIRVKEYEIK